MSVAEPETVPQVRLPLEGGGRCVRGLDGDHNAREFLDRRLSRWTHRVGVSRSSIRQTPPPDGPNELAPYGSSCGARRSKQAVLTRGASSSPLKGEAVAVGSRP
jgi:hypothetical protein